MPVLERFEYISSSELRGDTPAPDRNDDPDTGERFRGVFVEPYEVGRFIDVTHGRDHAMFFISTRLPMALNDYDPTGIGERYLVTAFPESRKKQTLGSRLEPVDLAIFDAFENRLQPIKLVPKNHGDTPETLTIKVKGKPDLRYILQGESIPIRAEVMESNVVFKIVNAQRKAAETALGKQAPKRRSHRSSASAERS